MGAILLIIIGVVVGGWAAKANQTIESQRPVILQGPLGGLIQFVCQFGGLGLVIYGLVLLFS
ncbi:MAG: hypothetical protein HOP34_00650 [Methylococcaceae bacterium]|nr:hypothetical protein [Methylococcaceae bacterium]